MVMMVLYRIGSLTVNNSIFTSNTSMDDSDIYSNSGLIVSNNFHKQLCN